MSVRQHLTPADIAARVNARYGNCAIDAAGEDYQPEANADIATAFGYTQEELKAIPERANLGLSCGNPVALANLKEGEVVVDLGSGAGFDVFVAAQKIGSHGKAIGVDMNHDMITLARRNASRHSYTNVSFVESDITRSPLADGTADCIISNCVINLVPHSQKHMVFEDMFRLLKPGGRVAVSDMLALKELPDAIRSNIAAYVGCIAGAAQVSQYEQWLREAGFTEVLLVDTRQDANLYKKQECAMPDSSQGERCCGSPSTAKDLTTSLALSLDDYDLNDWIASFQIYAVKQ